MNSRLVPLVSLSALLAMAACHAGTSQSDDTSHHSPDESDASVVDATSDAAPEASGDSGSCCETSFNDAAMRCSEYNYWSTCGDYVQFFSWGTDFWAYCMYDRKSGSLVSGLSNFNGEMCSWGTPPDCGTWVSQCPTDASTDARD